MAPVTMKNPGRKRTLRTLRSATMVDGRNPLSDITTKIASASNKNSPSIEKMDLSVADSTSARSVQSVVANDLYLKGDRSTTSKFLLAYRDWEEEFRRAQVPIVAIPSTISNIHLPITSSFDSKALRSESTESLSFVTTAYQDYGFLSHCSDKCAALFAVGLESEFRQQERIQLINPDIMCNNNQGFTVAHRAVMVNALLLFYRSKQWSALTQHLSVALLDRFLSTALLELDSDDSVVSLGDPFYRSVVTCTALWVAYKAEECQVGFNFNWLSTLLLPHLGEGLILDKAAIVQCEARLTRLLSFRLNVPTVQHYLAILTPVAEFADVPEGYVLAKCLAERCLLEHSLLKFGSSMVASAIVYLARALYKATDESLGFAEPWSASLVGYTNRRVIDLLPCVNAIQRILQREAHSRARSYAHRLLCSGSHFSMETLLRTIQYMNGNNSKSNMGVSLQPFSFWNPSGRISKDLQKYHDILPSLLLDLEACVLDELVPFPARAKGLDNKRRDNIVLHNISRSPSLSESVIRNVRVDASFSPSLDECMPVRFRMHTFSTFGIEVGHRQAVMEDVSVTANDTDWSTSYDVARAASQISAPTQLSTRATECIEIASLTYLPLFSDSGENTFEENETIALDTKENTAVISQMTEIKSCTSASIGSVNESYLNAHPYNEQLHEKENVVGRSSVPSISEVRTLKRKSPNVPFMDPTPFCQTYRRPKYSNSSVEGPLISFSCPLIDINVANALCSDTVLSTSFVPICHQMPTVVVPDSIQKKYQLYPSGERVSSEVPEKLLDNAIKNVDHLETVFDTVRLRHRTIYDKLVVCAPY